MKTLPDYLREDLDILSIGLNPSINSVRAGFYFATPQNRFWKALNASTLVNEPLVPGRESQEVLFERYGIGFTDVVKRPSSSGSQLRAVDFRKWIPVLQEILTRYHPRIAWFHGKVAYRAFAKYALHSNEDLPWGLQCQTVGDTQIFVTPNPSPANAAFSLHDLIESYNQLSLVSRGG
ncbi:MAG: mismatch-specific DNA-glycosylase [Gammaproteobacteria bacterium]